MRQFAQESSCANGEELAVPVVADIAGAHRNGRSGLSHYGQCNSGFPGLDGLRLHGSILGVIFAYLFISRTPFTANRYAPL